MRSSLVAPDFVDKNRYANTSFLDFSTQALVNNFILLPRPAGAGAAIEWNPGAYSVKLRAMYVAGDASDRLPDNQRLFGGGGLRDIRLFPAGGGGASGGIFGDPCQGIFEVEYSPGKAFAVRLQYGGGKLFSSAFHAVGINFDWTLSDRVGVFGRYGYATYPNTTIGTLTPNYWMAGLAFPDLFVPRAIAGFALGQPFIDSAVGNATQTNFEVFYNFPVSDRIRITPLLQIVANPSNQEANGTIVSGTLRAVFSF
jgi:Carbohydrate-selective porin, OprB family